MNINEEGYFILVIEEEHFEPSQANLRIKFLNMKIWRVNF